MAPRRPSHSKEPVEASSEEEEGASETALKKIPAAKKLFERVWSEEDEIVILKGMIEFGKGTDNGSFYDFIKNSKSSSIHLDDFTKTQLRDKVRRLRNKYEKAKKNKNNNKHSPRQKTAFELSEKLWARPRPNPSPVPEALMEALMDSGLSESFLRRGLELIPEAKKADLLAKWTNIHLAQLDLFSDRTKLLSHHCSLISKALNSDP